MSGTVPESSSPVSAAAPTASPVVVLLMRGRPADAATAAILDALAAELRGTGTPFTVKPSLYDLPDDAAGAEFPRRVPGELLVLGPYPPRALKWLFARRVPESAEFSARLRCFDIRGHAVQEALAFVRDALAGRAAAALLETSPGEADAARDTARELTRRWYPVIDYDRCTACMECLDFCLFGVFGVGAGGKLLVTQPDLCRPNCPACARVCSVGAIMFPAAGEPDVSGAVKEAPPARGLTEREEAEAERRACRSSEAVPEEAAKETDAAENLEVMEQTGRGGGKSPAELADEFDRLDI